MSAGNMVVIVVAGALVAAFLVWMVVRRNDPERAASHDDGTRTGSALYHGDTDDRPAGPGAEADGVAGPGEPVPGPSAESPPDPRH
jgi:hypothetical protein